MTVNHSVAGVSLGSTIGGEFWVSVTDHLGSGSVTRDSDGDARTQRYTPFGAVRAVNLENGLPTDEGFTGQTSDPGLGLIDFNARSYDPQLGRFVMADTVLDGLNRYTYVRNNPLNSTDPTGHCGWRDPLCLNEIGGAAEAVGKIVVREMSEASGFGGPRSAEGYADPIDYIISEMQENMTVALPTFPGTLKGMVVSAAVGLRKDLLFANRVRPGGRLDQKSTINAAFEDE